MLKMKKFKIDGKMFEWKNNKPIPSKPLIQKAYRKIPDDKRIPVVFQTKKQYLQEYIKNQERQKGIRFSQEEKKQYIDSELFNMQGITSRYTTKHNPYMEPKVVFFNDNGVDKTQFTQNAVHEYGHELWEKNHKIQHDWSKNNIKPNTSPSAYGTTDEEEDFAESYAMYKLPAGDLTNLVPKSQVNKRMDVIEKDDKGKNYVYLSKNKQHKHLPAYTYNRGNIFIGNLQTENIDAVSRLLGHEELHNALRNSIDLDTSGKLDNISVPYIYNPKTGKPVYPNTVSVISPAYKRYMEADKQEEVDKQWEIMKYNYPGIESDEDGKNNEIYETGNIQDIDSLKTSEYGLDNLGLNMGTMGDGLDNARTQPEPDLTAENKRLMDYDGDDRHMDPTKRRIKFTPEQWMKIQAQKAIGMRNAEAHEERIGEDEDSENYIRLSNKPKQERKTVMYVKSDKEDSDIYIDNAPNMDDVNVVSNALAHEEMHNLLKQEGYDTEANSGFDIITAPALIDYDNPGQVLNPRTQGNIHGIRESNIEAVRNEIGDETFEKQNVNNRMHGYYNQVILRNQRYKK